jgi:hypothetical protein
LMLFICDMANNIKCFRVDVTLTPGMWASSNIHHIQNSVQVIPNVFEKEPLVSVLTFFI